MNRRDDLDGAHGCVSSLVIVLGLWAIAATSVITWEKCSGHQATVQVKR